MKVWLHPEAALEHEEQVAYYEARAVGLGRRYHAALLFREASGEIQVLAIAHLRRRPGYWASRL